jgi:hypothetical protein
MTSDGNTHPTDLHTSAQESEARPARTTDRTNFIGPPLQPEIAEQCEKIVREFRLDKVAAVIELIPNAPDEREHFDRAFRS